MGGHADTDPRHPDNATDAELLDASIDALAEVVQRLDKMRNKQQVAQQHNQQSAAKLAAKRAARSYPKLATTTRTAITVSHRIRSRRDTR